MAADRPPYTRYRRTRGRRDSVRCVSIARDHAVDLDGFTGARVRVGDEDSRRAPEPSARLSPADVLGGALRAVTLDHPDGLALVKGTVTDVVDSVGIKVLHKWAIQDSNLGPLPYQRSALTI